MWICIWRQHLWTTCALSTRHDSSMYTLAFIYMHTISCVTQRWPNLYFLLMLTDSSHQCQQQLLYWFHSLIASSSCCGIWSCWLCHGSWLWTYGKVRYLAHSFMQKYQSYFHAEALWQVLSRIVPIPWVNIKSPSDDNVDFTNMNPCRSRV